jgi:hypothetical protein
MRSGRTGPPDAVNPSGFHPAMESLKTRPWGRRGGAPMKKGLFTIAALLLVMSLARASAALTTTSTVGDKDGFGIGSQADQPFNFGALSPLQPGEVTDGWTFLSVLPLTWTHTYDVSGISVLSNATLELFAGGQGSFGDSELFLDGQFVGTLSDGDVNGQNIARRDLFDLTPFAASLLDGSATFTVYNRGSDGSFANDNWVLDFSELTLRNDSPAPVPEPSTVVLLGIGLLGAALRLRRKIPGATVRG